MDIAVAVLLFIMVLVGIQNGSLITTLIPIGVLLFMSRDLLPYFVLGSGVAYVLRMFVPEMETWAALSLAVFALLMVAAGKLWKKEEEEIPPEMMPYLLAMMEGKR